MALVIVYCILALSLAASVLGLKALLKDWRKFHQAHYGTMTFDGPMARPIVSGLAVLSHVLFLGMSLSFLVVGVLMYQLVEHPILM